MHQDVKSYCDTCHLCQTKKHLNQAYRAPLKPIVVDQSWELLGFDGTGPLPETTQGNRYILVVIDYFSKFCVAKAVSDMTALTTAKFLFDEVICRFGMPKSLISDHGKNFKSVLFAELCRLCQIETRNSTFYHPEGNGLVERMNKTIKQILTMYVNTSHSNWDVHLQAAISAYNTSIQDSIGSPYEVVFGRKATHLVDVVLPTPVKVEKKPLAQYIQDLKQNVTEINQRVATNVRLSQERQKQYYDRFVRSSVSFEIGDLVRLINERSIVGESKSFRNRTTGPYKVIAKFNEVNYTILSIETKKSQNVHFNRLRPYRARDNSFSCYSEQADGLVVPKATKLLDPLIDSFLLSQFILAIRANQPNNLVESEVVHVEPVLSVDLNETIDVNQIDEVIIENSDPQNLVNDDSADNHNKTPCPVCNQLYQRVGVHLANKKDANHINYVRETKRRETVQIIDALNTTL